MKDEQLAEVLIAGNSSACLDFFDGMPETDRVARSKQCVAYYREQADSRSDWPGRDDRDVWVTAAVAIFATCGAKEIIKELHPSFPSHDVIVSVMRSRRPEWIDDWALRYLKRRVWSAWQPVRRLIAEGVCPQLDDAAYICAMYVGMVRKDKSIAEALQADPSMLEFEVWKIFEYEGGAQTTVLYHDNESPPGGGWLDALVSLAEQDVLSRSRLLDCSLDTLGRGFKKGVQWFQNLHDALEPSGSELALRLGRYLELAGSDKAKIASWAFGQVKNTAASEECDFNLLLEGLRPVLRTGKKATVKAAMKLIDQAVKSDPALAATATEVRQEIAQNADSSLHELARK